MDSGGLEVQANVSTPGAEPKSWAELYVVPLTPAIIAIVTVLGGLYILAFGADNKAAIMGPIVMAIIGYYFGTGAGSQAKDKIIAALKGNGK